MTVSLNTFSDQLQQGIKTVLGAQLKPPHRLKNLLHGTPLRHPLHPALVSVPIGALVVAAALDAMWLPQRRANSWAAPAARFTTLIGTAGAVAAIATGLADWSDMAGKPRQLGLLHGALNLGAFGLFAASSVLRLRRPQGDSVTAAAIGFAGVGILGITGYIGGEMVYKYGADINHTAFEADNGDFVSVMALADLPEGVMRRADAAGVPVVLLRQGSAISALAATCTHAGGLLDEGTLDGDVVTCPWHGSRFCFRDGRVLDGPATASAPRYDVRVRNSQIEVRRVTA